MENNITKYDAYLAEMEENIRFYLSTPERFAQALIFAKKLKTFAETIEEKVKKRGSEIMTDENLKQIDFDGFRVMQIDPTFTDEYSVSSLIEAVGIEIARSLMKVDNTKLKMWIKKSRIEGEILGKISEGKKTKERKGFIKLVEIKDEKND